MSAEGSPRRRSWHPRAIGRRRRPGESLASFLERVKPELVLFQRNRRREVLGLPRVTEES